MEVKDISCMGLVVLIFGDNLGAESPSCLPMLADRMRNEITRLAAWKNKSGSKDKNEQKGKREVTSNQAAGGGGGSRESVSHRGVGRNSSVGGGSNNNVTIGPFQPTASLMDETMKKFTNIILVLQYAPFYKMYSPEIIDRKRKAVRKGKEPPKGFTIHGFRAATKVNVSEDEYNFNTKHHDTETINQIKYGLSSKVQKSRFPSFDFKYPPQWLEAECKKYWPNLEGMDYDLWLQQFSKHGSIVAREMSGLEYMKKALSIAGPIINDLNGAMEQKHQGMSLRYAEDLYQIVRGLYGVEPKI